MFYTVYKTTNKINGKIYIGCHKTENLDDGYMGSGIMLKRAIAKHGLENFVKEILHVFATPEEMFETEKMLVVMGPSSYNLKEGGSGGFDYINRKLLGGRQLLGQREFMRRWQDPEYRKEISRQRKIRCSSPEYKRRCSERQLARSKRERELGIVRQPFIGKRHSPETKKKIGAATSRAQSGSGNSQYGMMWITNGRESARIRKTDSIPEGFRRGRVISLFV